MNQSLSIHAKRQRKMETNAKVTPAIKKILPKPKVDRDKSLKFLSASRTIGVTEERFILMEEKARATLFCLAKSVFTAKLAYVEDATIQPPDKIAKISANLKRFSRLDII